MYQPATKHDPTTIPAVPALDRDSILIQIVRACYDVMGTFTREVGISQTRLQMIGLLRKNTEMSQAELQRNLHVDGAAITRQVKQLADEGLVSRRVNPADNRYTLVSLTDTGIRLGEQLAVSRAAFITRAYEGLSAADVETIERGLAVIRDNLRSIREDHVAE